MAVCSIASTACSSPPLPSFISSATSRASACTSHPESSLANPRSLSSLGGEEAACTVIVNPESFHQISAVDNWKYQPAHDLGLDSEARRKSVQRESGLMGLIARNLWWWW